MTKLVLIRHGETETNKEWELHRNDDPEILNEKGRQQIRRTAFAIKKFSPVIIYASKEARAQESGRIISKILGIPLKTMVNMQERNWGNFSGKKWPKVQAILECMTLEERYNYVPPNGESWKNCENRLKKTLNDILKKSEGKTISIISHGGSIRILMPYLLNKPEEETFKHDPPNGSISVFDYENGKFNKILLEETSHLN